MKKIPTAKAWIKHYEENAYPGTPLSEAMIEFAKLHVEAALKEASESVCTLDSILNSYPLENIK